MTPPTRTRPLSRTHARARVCTSTPALTLNDVHVHAQEPITGFSTTAGEDGTEYAQCHVLYFLRSSAGV